MNKTFSANSKGEITRKPLLVLSDPGTASAGEIFAGVIGESGRGPIVGEESTFGKWTAQCLIPLGEKKNAYGGKLVLTVSRTLLFTDFAPQGKGYPSHYIIPDRELRQVVAQRRVAQKRTPLHEMDYRADRIVSPIASAGKRLPTGALASSLSAFFEQHPIEQELSECAAEDDCTAQIAVKLLHTMSDLHPEWPSINTKN